MKKKIAILVASLVIAMMLSSISYAQETGNINFDEAPYEVSIQLVGLFEENRDIEKVEEALNAITLEKINCTVDIVPVFIGNLATTTSLGVAGDEKLDIVVAGLTSPMDSMVDDDLLLPLDELLAERGQNILDVTAHVAEAQKINGQTYAVTGYPYAALAAGFVYNKEMADKYGIDMHDDMTMEELSAAGEILKENGIYLTTVGNSDQIQYKFFYNGDFFGASAAFGGILNPLESTTVENVFNTQQMRDFYKVLKSWTDNGYMPTDQLTDTTTVQEYFAQQHIFGTGTSYDPGVLAMWINSNFEADIIRISQPTISTASVGEFMFGIAANCKRPDKAMDLLNLIYSDPDVVNLLQYGVEGIDYAAIEGTDNVITYDGTENADHNGYYTPFNRTGSQMDRKIVAPLTDNYYAELQQFENEAGKSLTFGYTYNGEGFGAEAGAIASVLSQKLPMLNAGLVQDVDAAIDELVAALEAVGINDVIADNQSKLDAFLAQ